MKQYISSSSPSIRLSSYHPRHKAQDTRHHHPNSNQVHPAVQLEAITESTTKTTQHSRQRPLDTALDPRSGSRELAPLLPTLQLQRYVWGIQTVQAPRNLTLTMGFLIRDSLRAEYVRMRCSLPIRDEVRGGERRNELLRIACFAYQCCTGRVCVWS